MLLGPLLSRWYPLLFVLLWSTGFIGAKYGLAHAEPLSFLLIRYLLVIALMTSLALAMRAPWPRDGRHWFHIGVSGLLVHATYLGGVFVAIHQGLPAGITALVVGLQPIFTALGAGWLLGERVAGRQWLGLVMGLGGTALVVSGKLGGGFGSHALVPAVVALAGITAGTLYQKRFCPSFDLRTGAVAQFIPAAVATLLAVSLTEEFRVEWTPAFVFALGWLVLVLSVGAIGLLNLLIRSGSAVNVASLFYLTPATTSLIAWAAFGETLPGPALAGMGLAVWGVYLSRR
ncbi:putative inner membrane transporter YedA [Rhodocyclaceae bacterium]|nr:putative inner membrane transporter YedA [Rhodocyclaceae bacterium]